MALNINMEAILEQLRTQHERDGLVFPPGSLGRFLERVRKGEIQVLSRLDPIPLPVLEGPPFPKSTIKIEMRSTTVIYRKGC